MSIDLKLFCCDSYRYHEPFVLRGNHVATDGKIMVLIPCDEPDTPCIRNLNYESVMEPAKFVTQWEPIAIPDCDCTRCNKSGIIHHAENNCETCRGTGIEKCFHCGNEIECEDCDGQGKIEAYKEVCGCSVEILSRQIATDLANKMRSLPNLFGNISSAEDKILFKFKGGVGAVMPLVSE